MMNWMKKKNVNNHGSTFGNAVISNNYLIIKLLIIPLLLISELF